MSQTKPSLREIFSAALEIESAEQRQAFLDAACAGDIAIRQKVDDLLAAHLAAGELPETGGADEATCGMPMAVEQRDTFIGPYCLRKKIGEGGFGVVYVAEQTRPVAREVALKIIKPGMDTREVIARFEAERQALALMDHPNVAHVLDAGTTEAGYPYFVMELVRGMPITKFCDAQHLTNRERLRLFIDVCRGVQHAHQKGIIHRDLKPSNIMVTMQDDKPVPKVIDFGVSKALNQKLTEKSVCTALGQMVGTPMYMSPEQAQMSGLDCDTRSDVYSLGVLLYELLTGATPFDKKMLEKAGFDEMRRIVREDEPPRPSVMVSTLKAEALTTAADLRQINRRRLSESLRGELDWIVMKALEKDRARRYQSASRFAEDVQHYLCDEPVEACPPSSVYRFRKFARRNQTTLVAGALVVASLIVGTGISIWQAVRATEAEQLAQARLEEIGLQQRQTEAQAERAEANLKLALDTLEQIYLPLAEEEFSAETELSDRDRQFLQKALPFYEQLAAQKAHDPQLRFVKANAYLRVGNIYRNLRTHPDEKIEPAEAAFRRAISLFQQLVDEVPENHTHQQKLAQSYRGLGTLLLLRRRRDAIQAFRTAIRLYEPVIAKSGSAWDFASRGYCYRQIRRNEEALADYLKAVELEPNDAQLHQNLCQLYTDVSVIDLDLAVEHARKAVELEPNNSKYCSELAYVYLRTGNLGAAREASTEALRLDPNLVQANLQMAEILRLEGKGDEALAFVQKGFQGYEPEPAALQSRGKIYSLLGRYSEAIADLSKALELKPANPHLYRARGHVYAKFGRFDQALADYTKAIELGPENERLLNNVAFEMVRVPGWEPEMLEHPIKWVRRAMELHPGGAPHWNTLGLGYYRAGNWPEAIKALEKSVALHPDRLLGYSGFVLAMAHWQIGNQDEARQWYDRSVEWAEKHRLTNEKELLRFRTEAEELMGIEEQDTDQSEDRRDSPAAKAKAGGNVAAPPDAVND